MYTTNTVTRKSLKAHVCRCINTLGLGTLGLDTLMLTIVGISILATSLAYGEDRIDLETTIIKGNTELPQILYVVPWKESKEKASKQQKLVLHSLFGDLLDPQAPAAPEKIQTK